MHAVIQCDIPWPGIDMELQCDMSKTSNVSLMSDDSSTEDEIPTPVRKKQTPDDAAWEYESCDTEKESEEDYVESHYAEQNVWSENKFLSPV